MFAFESGVKLKHSNSVGRSSQMATCNLPETVMPLTTVLGMSCTNTTNPLGVFGAHV